jgi:hypothetical protein
VSPEAACALGANVLKWGVLPVSPEGPRAQGANLLTCGVLPVSPEGPRAQGASVLTCGVVSHRFNCGAPGKLFRCLELAQLTEGGLGRSKPMTNLIESTVTHCVECIYYIQALLSCLPQK